MRGSSRRCCNTRSSGRIRRWVFTIGFWHPNPATTLRLTALMKKGETLFSLAATDPTNYAKAIAVWQMVAADPAASRRWKNEALAKIGDAYRKTGDTDAALAAYYDVLNAGQEKEPEYFWYYKAGFEAGRLFETQKRYKEAIAIYDKLSAIDGPRAEEAKARINRIRLDNFLWEDRRIRTAR